MCQLFKIAFFFFCSFICMLSSTRSSAHRVYMRAVNIMRIFALEPYANLYSDLVRGLSIRRREWEQAKLFCSSWRQCRWLSCISCIVNIQFLRAVAKKKHTQRYNEGGKLFSRLSRLWIENLPRMLLSIAISRTREMLSFSLLFQFLKRILCWSGDAFADTNKMLSRSAWHTNT